MAFDIGPYRPYRDTVRPEWVDYNGHLRDAFYALIFSYATDTLIDRIGLDAAGRERDHASVYTLECHINFLREVKVGSDVEVHTQLLAADAKRLHIYHSMVLAGQSEPVAASEQMLLHVNTRVPKSAVFSPQVLPAVQALLAAHAGLARPSHAGRVIRLP